MNMQDTAINRQLRQRLLERADQLAAIASRPVDVADAEVHDSGDDSIREAMDEVNDARAGQALADLGAVREALRRMDAGTYGLCLDCGDAIVEGRLLAMPETRYCSACEQAREDAARRP